jgi:hypothetical protein
MEGKFVFRRINFPRLCAKATTRRPSIICNSLYANRGQMHSDTPTRGCTACTKCVSRQIITCPEQNQGFIREKMYTPGTGMVIYLICIFHSLTGYHSCARNCRHGLRGSVASASAPCSGDRFNGSYSPDLLSSRLMGKPSTWGGERRGGSRGRRSGSLARG